MADELTTQPAAAAQAAQPAVEAVVVDTKSVSVTTDGAPASTSETQPTIAPVRKWAGKYDTPEELERGYSESSSEAMRLQRELLQARQTPATPAQPTTPSYSAEQLETWKEQRLLESVQAAASGDSQKAAEATHQVRLIDAELRKLDLSQFSTKTESQMAMQALSQVAQPVLDQYMPDLKPGSALQTAASQFYTQAMTALKGGATLEQVVGAAAVLLAAHTTGKTTQGVSAAASRQVTEALNKGLKAAAVANAGGASNAAAAPTAIPPPGTKEFREYRKSLGFGK